MSLGTKYQRSRVKAQAGFSTLELVVVIGIGAVLAAIAIPQWLQMRRSMRISGDARSLAGDLNVAKMRAGANFTHARVFLSTGANPFHRVDVWNKSLGANGCWVPDGIANPVVGDCIGGSAAGGAYAATMSPNVTTGTGGAGAPPEVQAGPCLDTAGGGIANTACIVFNSRGFPIDGAGAPLAGGGFYFTDGTQVYGVTVSAMGLQHTRSIQANSTGSWAYR
jgi:type II secretory pathway pseudopilin PulG